MTTIAYHAGRMASDSRIIKHMGTPAERSVMGEKIYLTQCGRAYIGKAGIRLTQKSMEELAQHLLVQIIIYEEDNSAKLDFSNMIEGEAIIVMTKDKSYLVNEETLIPLEFDDIATLGSGEDFARMALIAGCSVSVAVEYAIKHDRYSGGDVHLCQASKLSPLVNAVKTKRRKTP